MANAFVKIGTALFKHQMKKLVGEEALGVISEGLVDIGGDKLDVWLGENRNASNYHFDTFETISLSHTGECVLK